MNRKDCDNRFTNSSVWALAVAMFLGAGGYCETLAGSIRLWPTAVVVGNSIRLDDIGELSGFAAGESRKLSELIITGAPTAGGSRAVSLELVRSIVATSGTNMAYVRLVGATECAVSRPAALVQDAALPASTQRANGSNGPVTPRSIATVGRQTRLTLRKAVVDFCNKGVARYSATADVTFDHTASQVLELAEPEYTFRVRRRGPDAVGLVPLEVDVIAGGNVVQTVPLVVQVVMDRSVLVARRTINKDASIGSRDLQLVQLSFNRPKAIGLTDPARAIGQRAKRVIPAGTSLQAEMLEPVPVILRGQLITLSSVAGAIQVVTTAKAGADGLVGDVIKVRSVEDRRVEFDAIVTGPGHAQVGRSLSRVAKGDGS